MSRVLAAAVLWGILAAPAPALPVPPLQGRVNDTARMLDAATAQRLERSLAQLESRTSHQVAVLTIPSLGGEALEDYSLKVARTWKLGGAGRNDGVLLLIARDDRKMRIEVGYRLEGALPDAECGRIMDGAIAPRFRAGDFSGGIAAGVDGIAAALTGEGAPAPARAPLPPGPRGQQFDNAGMVAVYFAGLLVLEFVGALSGSLLFYLFLFPFWGSWAALVGSRTLGGVLQLGHAVVYPLLAFGLGLSRWGVAQRRGRGSGFFIGGSRWSGGGSSWGGDGGGFSGGGGSFGGGGASGSW